MTTNKLPANPKAYAKAQALAKVTPGNVVKIPSIETLHYYCQIHGLRVRGWRGNVLVLEKNPAAAQEETKA